MNKFDLKNTKNQTIVLSKLNRFNKTILFFIASLILIQTSISSAYIPEIGFILKKSSLTTGKSILQIEQEVTFKIGDEEAKIDETWLIEGDKNLKMKAVGKNLYKDNIKLNYLYNGKNKTYFSGKNKIINSTPQDFYQKYLFIRSQNSFLEYLKELNISSNVRLSRADGIVSFLIGQASDKILNPHIWIGQEDFILRKIRMPSGSEISLGQITNLAKETNIAKSQTISWLSTQSNANVVVQIKIKKINVSVKENINSFYPQNIENPSEINFSNTTILSSVIEEFYSRFR